MTPLASAGRFESLAWLFGFVVACVALKGVFEFLQESLVGSIANRTLYDLRNRYFRNVVHLDLSHFNDQGTHGLMANFTNDNVAFTTLNEYVYEDSAPNGMWIYSGVWDQIPTFVEQFLAGQIQASPAP